MSDANIEKPAFPPAVAAIERRGAVVWKAPGPADALRAKFDAGAIPVVGIRHVRLWDIQVDDERALPGRERTATSSGDLWEIRLRAKNGSLYEVESNLVEPAPWS